MPMRMPPPSEAQGVKCCQSIIMIEPLDVRYSYVSLISAPIA
jgi:hypothetical protein